MGHKASEGRCLGQKEHFHLLCEMRVSNLIMTQGHTLHTLKGKTQEERKCILSVSGRPCLSWQPAQCLVAVPSGSTYGNHWPVSCDLSGNLLVDMLLLCTCSQRGLRTLKTPKLKNFIEINVPLREVYIRHHCCIYYIHYIYCLLKSNK